MPYWKNYTSRISITYLQIAFSKMSLVQEFALNTVPPWPTKITKCNLVAHVSTKTLANSLRYETKIT